MQQICAFKSVPSNLHLQICFRCSHRDHCQVYVIKNCLRNQPSASALENTEPSVQSIPSKQKEMQYIAGVRAPLHQPQKQMFWLGFNRHIHYLCSYARRDKDRVNPTKQMHTHRKPCSDACSHGRCITFPGTFIMCSLQTSSTLSTPCFPYWLFWLWIFFCCCCCCFFLMCRVKFSRHFPAVDEFLMSKLASGAPCCTVILG